MTAQPGQASTIPPVYNPLTPNPFEQQVGYTDVTGGGPSTRRQQQFDDTQHPNRPFALSSR